jgi:hypothetical protein
MDVVGCMWYRSLAIAAVAAAASSKPSLCEVYSQSISYRFHNCIKLPRFMDFEAPVRCAFLSPVRAMAKLTWGVQNIGRSTEDKLVRRKSGRSANLLHPDRVSSS